jgi:anthranilate synthase component 1
LLESVEGGEKVGRYSVIGTGCQICFKAKKEKVEVINNGKRKVHQSKNPYLELERIIKEYTIEETPLTRYFGGMVGYLSYDVVRNFEKLSDETIDDLNLPEIYFFSPEELIIFDHIKHKMILVVHSDGKKSNNKCAKERIKILQKKLQTTPSFFRIKKQKSADTKNCITSNFKKKDYLDAVRKIKNYIYSGDVVQTVLSQRFAKKTNVDSFLVYRQLRSLNPSPYLFYLNFPELTLVGSSPELLVKVDGKKVQTNPIAGTRKRGKDDIEDEKLKVELLSDEKEKAEHLMLVDLGRNDLGRVCKFGSVKVSRFMKVEKYSHVMHIVSSVEGILKNKEDCFSSLSACFPAGTVSGAPKIRAMEIIEEIEKTKRGPYAGSIGYFSFSGDMDMAITIRTIIFHKGYAYVQAGGGIVADSIPEKEYEETKNKAEGLLKAIKFAEKNYAFND